MQNSLEGKMNDNGQRISYGENAAQIWKEIFN